MVPALEDGDQSARGQRKQAASEARVPVGAHAHLALYVAKCGIKACGDEYKLWRKLAQHGHDD